ncbi:LacI family DNA-binding transcriptional regulator [Haloactinopolyspora alba]|nr:LacI family DNA-binding transcriptional regulator [Haloactinopolyspora alba]
MKDVALRAGVSTATVSRVISGTAGVTEDVKQRVEAAIGATGYRPNRLARGLRRQSSMVWGLLISDIRNPFFTDTVRAVEDVAHAYGYSLVLCNSDEDLDKERHYIDVLTAERVAGLLLTPEHEDRTSVAAAVEAGVPVVAVDRRLRTSTVDTVLVDNQHGARQATRHLAEQGARRIAVLLGDERVTPHRERLKGYESALKSAGLPVDEELILRAGTHSAGAAESLRAAMLGTDPPDALFISNNQLTSRALPVLDGLGVRVPDDLLVACFDDLPLAPFVGGGLTVVEQPTYDLGRRAAELLIDQLEATAGIAREVLMAPQLIVRGSSRRARSARDRASGASPDRAAP